MFDIIPPMDKFFALFGKIVLVVVLLGGVAYGAYTLGKTSVPPIPGAASTTAAPTPTDDTGLMPEKTPATGATPQTKQTKVVKAGLDASSGLSFTKYQMTVPVDWVVSHTTTNEGTWVDTLTLTKGSSQLKIFQAATGGAICLYPSDTPMEGPSSSYDTYVEIITQSADVMRRSATTATSGTTKGFTVCMKSPVYGNFQLPTIYGHMSIATPLNPGSELLAEVDAMIASLKKL